MKNRLGIVKSAGVIDFVERDIPELKSHDVLIRIRASSICGSDLHIFKDKHPSVKLPVTVGHEFSGDVVSVGESVTKVMPGDRVTFEPVVVCGVCEACRQGQYGYCENISFTYRDGDGAMANYFTGHEDQVFILPEGISYEAGSLLEPLSVAVHAVRRADIRMGESVIILGAGAIGILIAAICRRTGASEVIIADFDDFRLETAMDLGATKIVNAAKNNILDVISRQTGGKGADKSFECVGMEQTFHQATHCLRRNGTATIVGIFEKPEIRISAARFVTHEIKVQGSQGYCWDFKIAQQLSREIDLEKLITHRFPLEELSKAFETALSRDINSIKICVIP